MQFPRHLARACSAGLLLTLLAGLSMSGCTGRAAPPPIQSTAAEPAPEMSSPREQIKRYETNLAAALRESSAKDEQIAQLLRQMAELQRQLDAVSADYNDLRDTRHRAAAGTVAFMREFCEAHAEIASYSGARRAIVLSNDLVFQPGSQALRPEAQSLLLALATHLSHESLVHFDVHIAVHSDVKPLEESTAAQLRREAWERSSSRAMDVAGALASGGISLERLTSLGAGDRDPIAPNDTAAGRRANRRVEISLLERESEPGLPATTMTDVRD